MFNNNKFLTYVCIFKALSIGKILTKKSKSDYVSHLFW